MQTRLGFLVCGVLAATLLASAGCQPTPSSPSASKPSFGASGDQSASQPASKPAASAQAAPAAQAPGKPIKLGLATSLTGPGAGPGANQRISSEIAVDELNAAGGINGSPIELVQYDVGLAPDQGVLGTRSLAEQGVVAMVGPITSGQWEVANPILDQLQVVAINANATKPDITTSKWAFRMAATDTDMIEPGIRGFRQRFPNVRRVVIAGDVREATSEFTVHHAFPEELRKLGFEILDTLEYPTGQTDFSALVTRMKGLNPEGVVTSSFMAEGLLLTREMERQGVKVPAFVSAVLWAFPFVNQAPGDFIDGWVTVGYADSFARDKRPDQERFIAEFDRRSEGNPNVPRPLNLSNLTIPYDIIKVVAEAARRAGVNGDTPVQDARTKVRDTLPAAVKDHQGVFQKYYEFKPDQDVRMEVYPLYADGANKAWIRF